MPLNENTLTDQGTLRQLIQVLSAFKRGNFQKRMPENLVGMDREVADLINEIIDIADELVREVSTASQQLGRHGKLDHRVDVNGMRGQWKNLVDLNNEIIDDLVTPTGELIRVIEEVAKGNLTESVALELNDTKLQGQHLRSAKLINTMVEQLRSFSSEVTRVAREVGTEGILGGQASVPGVSGSWKDLTDNVNGMATGLTAQVRNIAEVTTAVAQGDLTQKITVDAQGEVLALKETINNMVDQLGAFGDEVSRVAREVGTEGILGGQASVPGVSGTWKDLTDNVNGMASNLTAQVRDIAEVTTAVANGDLSRKITVEVHGEVLALKETINNMVDQLGAFGDEVSRVASEVGTEGILGGQASVPGVSGTWKDLTDNVNGMASNLTNQVRGISKQMTAVASGDLSKRFTADAKGEVAELADTINDMTDTLSVFSDQVTRVAQEVGIEGILGGQAQVPGVSGTWKDLTDSVNGMASNLTTQVRAIADVAEAVTDGEYSRNIQVEARGEVNDLKGSINLMIDTLRDTTQRSQEQDWLKTNLARVGRAVQEKQTHQTLAQQMFTELAELLSVHVGAYYQVITNESDGECLQFVHGYAFNNTKHLNSQIHFGEGLVGQCAIEKQRLFFSDAPSDYLEISSGLGSAKPVNVMVVPVIYEDKVKAVIEIASFQKFSVIHQVFIDQLSESLGMILNAIDSNTRTNMLLSQSQQLTSELQHQQLELKNSNEELAEKAYLLEQQKNQVEIKNAEIEETRKILEDRAQQLALTSKYKSDFLSSMSHELRTPLNSLLILANKLAENRDENLADEEVKYARTIHESGNALLSLINEILDLARIESGAVRLNKSPIEFDRITDFLERNYRHVAEDQGLSWSVYCDTSLPNSFETDGVRLFQILRNLLNNAFKFTDIGTVKVDISLVDSGWVNNTTTLEEASQVIAFSVIDSGIGINLEQQDIIFEAFQQADTGVAKSYGGTGLGLSISRDLAELLGGELVLQTSEKSEGSKFVLYLPVRVDEENANPSACLDSSPFIASPIIASAAKSDQAPLRENTKVRRADRADPKRPKTAKPKIEAVTDDREHIEAADDVMLIIENSTESKSMLIEAAHKQGLKAVVAANGREAIKLISTFTPTLISLDLILPDISGWSILSAIRSKESLLQVPVLIATNIENTESVAALGAFSFTEKPTDADQMSTRIADALHYKERQKRCLIVANEASLLYQAAWTFGGRVQVTWVSDCLAAFSRMQTENPFDAVIIDVAGKDIDALHEIKKLAIKHNQTTSRRALILGANEALGESLSNTAHVLQTQEELTRELVYLLHLDPDKLPNKIKQVIRAGMQRRENLNGVRVLAVDDDPRNLYALTALLEDEGIEVLTAKSGLTAIDLISTDRQIDLVLMDIMMPDMDGFETISNIRVDPANQRLPIVALTAKNMHGDRETCIQKGASDYISKPIIDERLLLDVIRLWVAA